MRVTLNIDDDVLFAAEDVARRDKKTVGLVISEWSRSALKTSAVLQNTSSGKAKPKPAFSEEDQRFYDLGFRTLPNRAGVESVTNELVNRIREIDGI